MFPVGIKGLLISKRSGLPEHTGLEGGRVIGMLYCILTPLGLCCSTSDTPAITRLLQLVGRFASELLTSYLKGVWCAGGT